MRIRTLLSWSSGKDSAWALHTLQQQGTYDVVGLLTTVNSAFDRVAMHGTRASVLRAQAAAAGLQLIEVPLPWPCSNQLYEAAMRDACAEAAGDGIEAMAFGDLYLEDVRRYREERLAGTGITPIFPLWGRDTTALVHEMLDSGLCCQAHLCRYNEAAPLLRRPRIGRVPARRVAARDRSMRREWRVPHLRLCRSDVCAAAIACAGCNRTARWFRFRGFHL